MVAAETPDRTLDVLVVESERGAADAAVIELERAGHRVHRCRDRGAPAFPCDGIAGDRTCPLDAAAIDVAVSVRGVPRSQPSVLEDGLSCAMQRHVPIVLTGRTALHPYDGYVTEAVPMAELLASVQRAAAQEMPEHQAHARAALDVALAVRGLAPSAGSVRVDRRDRGLRVTLRLPADLPRTDFDKIAVRVMGAVRAADSTAAFIDVAAG
jgi:hypothetical protein